MTPASRAEGPDDSRVRRRQGVEFRAGDGSHSPATEHGVFGHLLSRRRVLGAERAQCLRPGVPRRAR
eukprot:456455-Lingulodinium_polyedra.AAC.1